MKNPQEHTSLSARLGRAIVLFVLVIVASALVITDDFEISELDVLGDPVGSGEASSTC